MDLAQEEAQYDEPYVIGIGIFKATEFVKFHDEGWYLVNDVSQATVFQSKTKAKEEQNFWNFNCDLFESLNTNCRRLKSC